jgi:hypothetical protein
MSAKNRTTSRSVASPQRRRRVYKIAVVCLLLVLAAVLAIWLLAYGYNNLSLMGDRAFARRLDAAIENSHNWVRLNRQNILTRRNVALIRMLQDISTMRPDPLYSGIVESFMAGPARPDCWKRLLDPNWPVISSALNKTLEQEHIDNKWILYAIAPECANVTPEQIRLFDSEHWQERRLTHQLWALMHLCRTQGPNDKLNALIERLCDRITGSQRFDIAVVDLYIQKTAFVLKAGFPQKIRRRWIERVIANQEPDGGWNDKWFLFTSIKELPPGLSRSASNQHATVQALWLLYQVKCRYGDQFGLPD